MKSFGMFGLRCLAFLSVACAVMARAVSYTVSATRDLFAFAFPATVKLEPPSRDFAVVSFASARSKDRSYRGRVLARSPAFAFSGDGASARLAA